MEPREAGAVILAAGRSERMKEMKAFLPFDDNNRFLEKILSTYSGWGCSEIVVVTNPEAIQRMKLAGMVPSAVTIVVNDHMEFERFFSVKLGLGAIRSSSFCFIQDVDNPCIDSPILDLLYQHRSDEKYVSPVFENKRGHPVLLNRENMNRICKWNVNSANFKEVLGTFECQNVEMPDDRVLININSPEEYKRYFNIVRNGINLR
jgi:CTP:molybdopterin cytidylyltransferase MocA